MGYVAVFAAGVIYSAAVKREVRAYVKKVRKELGI